MSTIELLKNIVNRIKRCKFLILVLAVLFAIIFYLPEHNKKTVYTAKATLFPLNSDNDNSSTSLSGLLGLSDPTRSFGNDNSVNIIELTLSRTLMQTVASKRLAAVGNKTIAELLVTEKNSNTPFFTKKIDYPSDSISQAVVGGELLSGDFVAKINKNNVLEMYYSNTNTALLEPITDTIISEITKFYINLKIEKALADYNFAVIKLDSVQKVLDKLDNRAIGMQNTTLFTSDKLLSYKIPKDYVAGAKEDAMRQKETLLNNKDEASWRLQKLTPIVEILDKPQPPFASKRSTPLLMAAIGFVLGTLIAVLIAISGLLYAYAKFEIRKALLENNS
ncbi:MAG TPA: hypothetical protein VK718_09520 [Ferruginibacter sp.]|nr:hypothetical protein [Ferruginibacter sp.]